MLASRRIVAASLRRRLELLSLPASSGLAVNAVHRNLGTGDPGYGGKSSVFENIEASEKKLFGGADEFDTFFQSLDRVEKRRDRSGFELKRNSGSSTRFMDDYWEGLSDTLSDGMDTKLQKAAQMFVYSDEIYQDDYSYRPDVKFRPGTTYTTRDLDVRKPGIQKSFKRPEFETTTKEVLQKADFRNVRFLQNFLTEAGIIIKRSQTRISAKAQRKVAREIKTARAFGLMPFTSMGTKPFAFGRSMKDDDEEILMKPFMSARDQDNMPGSLGGYDATASAEPAVVET